MDLKEKNKKVKNNWKNRKFRASFLHALDGIKVILKEERNMRHHAALGFIPIALGFYFQIAAWEWAFILTCIFLVIMMEFVNTIFETVVDMITDYEFHPLAKRAKDIAAGAVLVSATFAVTIAALIFIPKFYAHFF